MFINLFIIQRLASTIASTVLVFALNPSRSWLWRVTQKASLVKLSRNWSVVGTVVSFSRLANKDYFDTFEGSRKAFSSLAASMTAANEGALVFRELFAQTFTLVDVILRQFFSGCWTDSFSYLLNFCLELREHILAAFPGVFWRHWSMHVLKIAELLFSVISVEVVDLHVRKDQNWDFWWLKLHSVSS